MKWFLARIGEPSTMAGIGLIFNACQTWFATHNTAAVIGQVVAGIGAVVVPEKSTGPQ